MDDTGATNHGSQEPHGMLHRIQATATWEQLASFPAAVSELKNACSEFSQGRNFLYLFTGPGNPNKLLAAEAIASSLGKDLYRVDLSAISSKYIGETEKNLRRLFDAAESGGAILFFDEADALFGKRSEVKDSHDRFANIEINYLLQQIKSYPGLAILSTNEKLHQEHPLMRLCRRKTDFP